MSVDGNKKIFWELGADDQSPESERCEKAGHGAHRGIGNQHRKIFILRNGTEKKKITKRGRGLFCLLPLSQVIENGRKRIRPSGGRGKSGGDEEKRALEGRCLGS